MTDSIVNIDYSVLMSVYAKDEPDYLDIAITSMVEQTVPFYDMVIVCDGPLTAKLDERLERWKGALGERLSIVRLQENVGLGAALNKGLPECRCDIVARMDADDVSRPERCEVLLAAMHVGNLDLVGGAIEEFDSVPGDLGVVRRLPEDRHMIERFAARRNPFNHVSVMFHRHMIEKAGGYQPFYLMEDYWLWARMLAMGCRCSNVPDVVVDVRVGSGMYKRRAGKAYLHSQIRFFSELRKLGLSTWEDAIISIAARCVSSIFPERVNQFVYQNLLRKKQADSSAQKIKNL